MYVKNTFQVKNKTIFFLMVFFVHQTNAIGKKSGFLNKYIAQNGQTLLFVPSLPRYYKWYKDYEIKVL